MKRSDIELRDWYAGLAMQAIIGARNWEAVTGEEVASEAFYMAEEMMDQRAGSLDSEVSDGEVS
jgi:hypothetical protein